MTTQSHRREVLWQITVPFIVGLLVIIGVAVLIAVAGASGNGDTGRWSQISTVWLVMLTCAPSLIFTLILGGLAYLLIRLVGILPPYAKKAQDFFYLVQIKVRSISDLISSPVIKTNSFWASLKTIFRP